jgi:hypothetical protein
MAFVSELVPKDTAFLPERRAAGASAAEELLRWAVWLDRGDHVGSGRDRSLDALVEAAEGNLVLLTTAWRRGLRARREGTARRTTVELLRAAVDRADSAAVDPPLSLF